MLFISCIIISQWLVTPISITSPVHKSIYHLYTCIGGIPEKTYLSYCKLGSFSHGCIKISCCFTEKFSNYYNSNLLMLLTAKSKIRLLNFQDDPKKGAKDYNPHFMIWNIPITFQRCMNSTWKWDFQICQLSWLLLEQSLQLWPPPWYNFDH